jgi:hypothetical protein
MALRPTAEARSHLSAWVNCGLGRTVTRVSTRSATWVGRAGSPVEHAAASVADAPAAARAKSGAILLTPAE